MEDIEDLLLKIEQELSQGKKTLIGSGTIIDAATIYGLVDRIRNSLPDVVREARYIVKTSSRRQQEEEEKAHQIISQAKNKADIILSEHELVKMAQKESEAIKSEALEFKNRIIKDIAKDIEIMLTGVEDKLLENLQIVRTALQQNSDKFELEGRSLENESISDLVEAISKIPYIRNVELKSVNVATEDGITVKSFTIYGDISL